jgi:pantetheine-phosphate adenylyltransferase
MVKRAIYPGSFDPITLGHVDVIERASVLFDEVLVAVAPSLRKSPLFDFDSRCALVRESVQACENIRVIALEGLLVDLARHYGASFVVKGLRSSLDADYEMPQAWMNERMSDSQLETVCLFAREKVAAISSTMVREILALGGDAGAFVPAPVMTHWQKLRG